MEKQSDSVYNNHMTVMQILSLVFLGLFIAASVVQLVASAKKTKLLEYICRPIQQAFLLSAALMALIPLLPDSRNIIVCSSCSFAAALASSLITFAPKQKNTLITATLLTEASVLSWLPLLMPSFKLFALPAVLTVLIAVAYLAKCK